MAYALQKSIPIDGHKHASTFDCVNASLRRANERSSPIIDHVANNYHADWTWEYAGKLNLNLATCSQPITGNGITFHAHIRIRMYMDVDSLHTYNHFIPEDFPVAYIRPHIRSNLNLWFVYFIVARTNVQIYTNLRAQAETAAKALETLAFVQCIHLRGESNVLVNYSYTIKHRALSGGGDDNNGVGIDVDAA